MAFTLLIGQSAPDFWLGGTDGKEYSLADFRGAKALVVAFWCNHCPYVIGSEDRMLAFVERFSPRGVKVVAINSNEAENHPLDAFPYMVERAKSKRYPFVYLRDEAQEVADDVQTGPPLVVGLHDPPRRLLRVGVGKHLVLRDRVLDPA